MSVVDETVRDHNNTNAVTHNDNDDIRINIHNHEISEPTQKDNNNTDNEQIQVDFNNDITDDNINHMIDDTLNEIDYEIIHDEEKELMNQYYNIIQTNIQYTKRRGRKLILQSYPLSTKQLEKNELVIDDTTIDHQKLDNTIITKSNSKKKQRRPQLQLYDTNYEIGTIGYIKNSYQHIDLQLIRTTILIPRFFTKKVVSNNNNHQSNNNNQNITIRIEQSKHECEQYLYMKFYKLCIQHKLIYTIPIYWKYFNISLQSANPNSWRCIVIGYKPMVNDVLLYLQHRVRPMKTKTKKI